MSLIVTEALTKRFGQVTAVSDLSVDIGPGVVGLIGASRAGKSTLIKILLRGELRSRRPAAARRRSRRHLVRQRPLRPLRLTGTES